MAENWKAFPTASVINKRLADFKRLQDCDTSTLNATITKYSKRIDDLAANAVAQFDVEQKEALKLMKATCLTAKTYINSKMADAMIAIDVSSSDYEMYVTAKMDAAVTEIDKSSSALNSLSASVLAKAKSALLSATKTYAAVLADTLTAASRTVIEDADDADVEDHGGATKAGGLITNLKKYEDNGTTTLADTDSQQPVTGRPDTPSTQRGANVLYADQDIRPDGMLQSHCTTNLSVNGPQSSNLSKLPANSPHKLRQPQQPRNPHPR